MHEIQNPAGTPEVPGAIPGTRERIATLSPRALSLLESRLQEARDTDQQITAQIRRRPRGDPLPVSFAQERLWFLEQMYTESSSYNLTFLTVFERPSLPLLKRCFYDLVRRHESLRTVIQLRNGQPVQIIAPTANPQIPQKDIRYMAGSKARQSLQSVLAEEAYRSFDLARGPLFRALLIRVTEDTYYLQVTLHHIISDGWSIQILRRELRDLFAAYSEYRSSPLEPLPIQYADFAVWQRQELGEKRLQGEFEFWRTQLEGAPPVLELPWSRPRPARLSTRGESQFFVLDEASMLALRRLVRDAEASLFMVTLAVFQVLLYKHTGRTDPVVGTPMANRNRAELEPVVGFFANTLVLRSSIDPAGSFRKFLEEIRQLTLTAQKHQELPFEKLVAELQPERSLDHHPLFQLMFSLEADARTEGETNLAALVHSESNDRGRSRVLATVQKSTSKFDMTVLLSENESHLSGVCEYNTDLFTADDIRRFLSHFLKLLGSAAMSPDSTIAHLEMFPIDEASKMDAARRRAAHSAAGRRVVRTCLKHLVQPGPLPPAPYVIALDEEGQPVPAGCVGRLYVGAPAAAQESSSGTAVDLRIGRRRSQLFARVSPTWSMEILGTDQELVQIAGRWLDLRTIKRLLCECNSVDDVLISRVDGRERGPSVVATLASAQDEDEVLSAVLRALEPEYRWLLPYVVAQVGESLESDHDDVRDFSELKPLTSRKRAEDDSDPSPVEISLLAIWRSALEVESLGRHDNFFDLGGDSFQAFRAVTSIEAMFEIEVPVLELFQNPTVSKLADCVARKQAAAAAGEASPSAEKLEDRLLEPGRLEGNPARAPLSFGQEQLWLIQRRLPTSSAYNVPLMMIWRSVDISALRNAIGEVVRRHQILRSVFPLENGVPVQRVQDSGRFDLAVIDLSGLDPVTGSACAQTLTRAEARRPFDLEVGPILRPMLFRVNRVDFCLLLSLHHIACDGWSFRILQQEIHALYATFGAGQPSPLREPECQYAQYARLQRRRFTGRRKSQLVDYWRSVLAGAPPLLEIPMARRRFLQQTHRGAVQEFTLPRHISEQIRDFASAAEATEFMVLLALYKVLLLRITGRQDLIVGTPVADRSKAEFEQLVGYCVNALVLRTRLVPTLGFEGCLQRVKSTILSAFAHQIPLKLLVEELPLQRSLAFHPLFQLMFAYQPQLQQLSAESLEEPGEIEPTPVFVTGSAKFDLTLSMSQSAGCFVGAFEYNTELFAHQTIRSLILHFRDLVEAAVSRPGQPIASLAYPLNASSMRCRRTDSPGCRGSATWSIQLTDVTSVHATKLPQSIALAGAELLTYENLETRVANLTGILVARVGDSSAVCAVCTTCFEAHVVALLAVLRAGAVYVPVDLRQPRRSVAAALAKLDPSLVLVSGDDSKIDVTVGRVVAINEISGACSRDEVEAARLDPGARAFCEPEEFYKPLSPRAISYRSLARTSAWLRHVYPCDSSDHVVVSLPVGSAGFLLSVLYALSSGATLSAAARSVPDGAGQGMDVVPSILFTRSLPESDSLPQESPRLIFCYSPARPAEFRRVRSSPLADQVRYIWGFPGHDLVSLVAERTKGTDSVGWRPVAGAEAIVLDAHGQPLPAGVVGQLHVTSDAGGLEQTTSEPASRWGADPGSKTHDERFMPTGHRAASLSGRRFDLLGEVGRNITLRGFEVNLDSVEDVLAAHPGAIEAAALLVGGRKTPPALRAYVVSTDCHESTPDRLDRFLRIRLPHQLLPTEYVRLNRPLLRTLRGRPRYDRIVRRRAVVETVRHEYVAPRTPTETTLAEIWSSLLRSPQIGIDDDFFDLDGDSLLAFRAIGRIRALFDVDVAITEFFRERTIRQLAAFVETAPKTSYRGVVAASYPPMEHASRDVSLPLSFAQERLWFLDQFEPGSPLYNVALRKDFSGDLDVSALQRAVCELVLRHESLRTTFSYIGDGPVQIIHAPNEPELDIVDLQHLPAASRSRRLRQEYQQIVWEPFDLERGPVLRHRIIRLTSQRSVLMLAMHHIVTDAWSMEILDRELTELYASYRDGTPSQLRPPTFQYADFAVWQRKWLNGEILHALIRFWREALAGAPPLLAIPTDRPRPVAQSFRGAAQALKLPVGTSPRVQNFSKKEASTPFLVLATVFTAMLHRWSDLEDIPIGTPVANRPITETEEMVGFFANTVIVRTQLEPALPFLELFGKVRSAALEAQAHSDLPFEKLVEELDPERSTHYNPLFQVLFVYQEGPREGTARDPVPGREKTSEMSPPELEPERIEHRTAKFDLTFTLIDRDEDLTVVAEYNTDIFEHVTLSRWLRYFKRLLASAIQNPDFRIGDLPLLSTAETETILYEWNRTEVFRETELLVHQIVERQVDRCPREIAVLDGRIRLSFRELDQRANQLAHRLIAAGVSANTPVGLSVGRSPWLAVAVLGVLKAGGACLPLDPRYPRRRLEFMVEDAGTPWVIVDAEGAALWSDSPVEFIHLDSDSVLDNVPTHRPSAAVGLANWAYVIYTSGSTGTPKGTMIPHRCLSNLVLWQVDGSGGRPLKTLQLAPLGFDVAFQEIFSTWGAGGTLCMISESDRSNPERLLELIGSYGIERLFLPFVALDQLARQIAVARAAPPTLCEVITAGEQLRISEEIEQWFERATDCCLRNQYGPSETHVVTEHRLQGSPAHWPRLPPIGGPIDNVVVYIVDRQNRPVPPGVAGEILVGGVAVGDGYLSRATMTSGRFVPDPFQGQDSGRRVYRTGDRGRFLPNGEVEFLGRMDQQVKVRGFRVEPGELEAAMTRHQDVLEAVVVAHGEGPVIRRLVAYVVPRAGVGSFEPGSLQSFLTEHLPEHMVPALVIALDTIPKIPSGKQDRLKLAKLPLPRRRAAPGAIGPRSPLEENIAKIWTDVLKIDSVGIEESFFDLGGHSLLATQLVALHQLVWRTIGLRVSGVMSSPPRWK